MLYAQVNLGSNTDSQKKKIRKGFWLIPVFLV